MKAMRSRNLARRLACTAALLTVATGWSATVTTTYDLRAEAFDKTLPGPRVVRMWGFAQDADLPTVPGPALVVAPVGPGDDSKLVINLTNNLTVPVSLVIPGQNGFVRSGGGPTIVGGRALSFAKETAPGDKVTYEWLNVQPGTYLYHSGSHPALQVQMGLYGALTKAVAAGEPYADIDVDNDITMLFSDVDVQVHDAIAAGTYATTIKSMIHSVPEYFLINGEGYTPAQVPLAVGSVGETLLVRLLSACSDTRIPVLNGYHLTVVAEDGRKVTYPKTLAAVDLPALKTLDVVVVLPAVADTLVLYDRRLGLVNGTAANGGMYQKLAVSP